MMEEHFCFFFSFLLFHCLSFFLSSNVSGLLACVCCACRIQSGGMAWRCLLPFLDYDVVCLCCSFVTCISRMKDQQTRGVLGAAG